MTKHEYRATVEAMNQLSTAVDDLYLLWNPEDDSCFTQGDMDAIERAHGLAKAALDEIDSVVMASEHYGKE